MSGRPKPGWCLTVDGANTTRRDSCTLILLVLFLTSYASLSLFGVFVSASRRIWDPGRAKDSARHAGHDGTICLLN